jgi:rhodanese-related sulfurtransferase
MAFEREKIESNRAWFAAKLGAEKQKNDVVKKVQEGQGDFLLLDTRGRPAFRKAHIRGAFCLPLEELEALAADLPRDRELVTYCWTDT